MKKILLIAGLLAATITMFAQDSAKVNQSGKLTFSGYAEAYYSYDFNKPSNHLKPGFLYNYNRHNELNINMAMLKANYTSDRVRGNFALMAGTYPEYNLATEPTIFQYVYEANVGVRIGKQVWIDAGIMPAHIGWESAIGKDCPTLTRSLAAENSPYYETGAKVSWTPNDKWLFAVMYLNGWQRIRKVNDNQTPSFGTQISFKPGDKVLLNWSTFIGNDLPDSIRQMRYFSDLYGTFNITGKFSLIAGFDYGWQQKSKGSSSFNSWFTTTMIGKYAFTNKLALAGRIEYYNDASGVIINTGTPHGFKTMGYSLNLDVSPVNNVLFRVEGRMFNGKDKIFNKGTDFKNTSTSLTASLSVWF
ncbi:porin [Chitinophaga silvatica]|uniref:Porin n=1 Tax=Chitinophaga silvatica TaxID=2282649 RepID=A0A3E1YC07_9BACT|nr:porin [Chitinophaga silvatica]RFS23539.1 porin [Chitinophaga silvatica]